jgi:transposase-like protein
MTSTTRSRTGGNSPNGTRTKTVLTEIGPVEIELPRDVDAGLGPIIVRKRQRRLSGTDEIVLSLTAKGLTRGDRRALSRRLPRLPQLVGARKPENGR